MDTNFGKFKMLAFRFIAGNELKDYANNATLSFKTSSMTLCMCVGLYDLYHNCIKKLGL